jgi:hypothetical protein
MKAFVVSRQPHQAFVPGLYQWKYNAHMPMKQDLLKSPEIMITSMKSFCYAIFSYFNLIVSNVEQILDKKFLFHFLENIFGLPCSGASMTRS